MIGDMLAKIRKEKGITKTELAKLTDINIGHLTHIEKGERNPSHKTLRNICKALDIPYQQLMYTYDKQLNEEQEMYGFVNHIPYDKVLAVNNIDSLMDCPSSMPSASLAVKLKDDSMAPKFNKGDYIFIEFNSPLNDSDIGIFSLNNEILVRKYAIKKKGIVLSPLNKNFSKSIVSNSDQFYIIGKVLEK